MSESKADKVSRLIERHVRDTLGAMALTRPADAAWISQQCRWIEIEVAARATRQYAMIELADIMKWKKPREI